METNTIEKPETFSALCAANVTAESQDTMVSSDHNRTTCMSPHDNLIWDD